MALNPLQFLVYTAALLCFWLGRRMSSQRPALLWGIAFALLAVPALCYDLYYLKVWDEPIWLYEVRSWPCSELLAAPAGLLAGWIQGRLRGPWRISTPTMAFLLLLALVVPYLKQFTGPMELTDQWKDGVCQQSSPSTCGPASAATLLTVMGRPTSEAELAKDSFSTATGTENWYLRRAIERRGVSTHYEFNPPPLEKLPYPAIAGIKLGRNTGHFIAILSESREGYVIGDPLGGRYILSHQNLLKQKVKFTGFFLVLESKGP